MKTEKSRALNALVWVAMLLMAAPAATQQQFDIPPQPSQSQRPNYRSSAPTPIPHVPAGADVRTLPQLSPQPPPALPPSANQASAYPQSPLPLPAYQNPPVLPAIFRGCWEGRVDYLDSIERLPGGAKIGTWTPKTYRLCYRRIGDGPFVLTFTDAGIEQNDKIINPEGHMTLMSTDGRSYAAMRSELDFDEVRTHPGLFGTGTFAVHELTQLNCRVQSDGMYVKGLVTGWRSATPWFRARWHTVFVHIGEPPQQVTAPANGIPE
jgi:hypothetical protein